MIPESTIEELKNINLTDVISHYVRLKRVGNEYVGLCPFHNEKTPSFHVHPSKGYYCFGCDAHGSNAIDFIMRIENKSFTDAVEQLATMTGTLISNDVPVSPIPKIKPIEPKEPQPIDFIPDELVSANLKAYKRNNLYLFVASLIGEDAASKVFIKYGIGSCKYYGEGTTLFVQRDINGNVRQLKAMLYDAATGHRRKEKEFEPKIIGKYINGMNKDANLMQCFFGEHILTLLINEDKSIAIVESEKTAVICSVFYPQFIWIATGGKNGCNMTKPEVNKVLKGRFIHLFPDVDGIEDWRKYADELRLQGFNLFLNDTMASYPELARTKKDIADLLTDVPAKPDSVPDWQLLNQKWIWINRLHNGSTDVPAWLIEAKNNLFLFREGKLEYPTYEDRQADVIRKYHVEDETFVETVNSYINSLN